MPFAGRSEGVIAGLGVAGVPSQGIDYEMDGSPSVDVFGRMQHCADR
jgi:hypothetical protein